MKYWLRGKSGGLIAFLLITGLVAGGLGWVTSAALRLEQEQRQARAESERYEHQRLALWRLDGRVSPVLAREDSRPYNHFSAVFAPAVALRHDASPWPPGTMLEVSPLVNAELPDWVLLHFQTDAEAGWSSPQVLSSTLAEKLARAGISVPSAGAPRRAEILQEFAQALPAPELLAHVQLKGAQTRLEDTTLVPSNTVTQSNAMEQQQLLPNMAVQQTKDLDYANRSSQQQRVKLEGKNPVYNDSPAVASNFIRNGESWFTGNQRRFPRSEQVAVSMGSMTPLWLTPADGRERLVLARLVHIGRKEVCQGLVIDWPRLQEVLAGEIHDLFASAKFEPVRTEPPPFPERTMTAVPVQLDPGPPTAPFAAPTWTPLRIGLSLAWAAALVALAAVALGGWVLLDLSERRIRFVSAVTHELRTPLTTLRLYLDMLTGGLIKEEHHRAEYLQTLHTETDRLNRLVCNVLDFSRLENQRPRLERTTVVAGDLLEQVRTTWQGRCAGVEKELVAEDQTKGKTSLHTDVQLVQQILGNLIDNACKYSRGAADRRIWLRARPGRRGRLLLEVEDRGPGVARRERHAIFRAFRRGSGSDVTAGGVGLGLALARRWARLLGGKLALQSGPDEAGACFRLELPCRIMAA